MSDGLKQAMDRADYYIELGGSRRLSFGYAEQRSFDLSWSLVPRGRKNQVFDCVRRWCLRRGFDPDGMVLWQHAKPLTPTPNVTQLKLRPIGAAKVYFIQESGVGAIKIGTAKNVKKRIQEMVVSTPHLLVVLAVIDGNRDVEQALHRRFSHARIRRRSGRSSEWFRPVPELLAYIAEVKAAA